MSDDNYHPDDAAVDRFAAMMKDKLRDARERGREGWYDPAVCSVDFLANELACHFMKGNDGTFEDVANYAMMLRLRNADPESLASHIRLHFSSYRLQRAEELLRQTNAELKEVLKEDGGCDHSVGICYCHWIRLTEDNDAFLGEQP